MQIQDRHDASSQHGPYYVIAGSNTILKLGCIMKGEFDIQQSCAKMHGLVGTFVQFGKTMHGERDFPPCNTIQQIMAEYLDHSESIFLGLDLEICGWYTTESSMLRTAGAGYEHKTNITCRTTRSAHGDTLRTRRRRAVFAYALGFRVYCGGGNTFAVGRSSVASYICSRANWCTRLSQVASIYSFTVVSLIGNFAWTLRAHRLDCPIALYIFRVEVALRA